jgi:hypothetical protein
MSLSVGAELTYFDRRKDGRTGMAKLFGAFHLKANELNKDEVRTSQRTAFEVVTDVVV